MPRKNKNKNKFSSQYAAMVSRGKDLLYHYQNGEKLVKGSRYNRIYMHYSRESIQQAMYEYARGRKIAALRNFQPLFAALKQPEDILPLAFCLAERGKLWPSLHGTVLRHIAGVRLCDLVLEVDFKSNWKVAFESARPLVTFLQDFGVDFKIKFSGNSSPHIIIPGEALPPEMKQTIYAQILDYANKYVKGRAHLDMSFRTGNHFLRLAYSINEQAGRVSVPIDPDEYNDFAPHKADIENVKILKDWWQVPPDAPNRTSEMIEFILAGKRIIIQKTVRKAAAKQFKQLPAQLFMTTDAKAREEVLRMFQMPYEQMLKIGQQLQQRRDELMEKPEVREAVDMLRAIHEKTGVVSVQEASGISGVEPADLWFLWRWLIREDIFNYYAREDIQEAMFLHSIDRKVRLGNEDLLVDLADPGHILPLAVYIHETQGGVDYPAFYCTNIKRDVTTDDIIGCDVAVKIDGKGDGAKAEQTARWVISLLRQAGADFAILIISRGLDPASSIQHPASSIQHLVSSIQNPVSYVIIPSEAVPGMPRNDHGFASVIGAMEKHIKKALPRSESISVLQMGEYIPLFYSVNEVSGLANIPVRADRLDAIPESGSLNEVQVMQDWWDIPGEPSAQMAELFRKVAMR